MKILIADDHAIVRQGITTILKKQYPFAEVSDVADSVDLLKKLMKDKWDLVISDISMPPGNCGIENIKQIKQVAPGTPVVILSMFPVDQYAVRAIRAGASGYLTKDTVPENLIVAVNQVLAGKKYLSQEVADAMADAFVNDSDNTSIENLSNREFEVFKLLSSGKSVADIAKEILLSTNTISTFRKKIFEKMGFSNNLELIRFAVDHRLV
jgi:two-component system invasion response regulator UvrY